MRLTCPNCGAQYEVPDEVIPLTGRDVQCSNCGDTWFQHHPDQMPDPDEEHTDDTLWDAPEEEEAPSDSVPDGASEEPPEPVRRELDPAVADVLREEAELERAAREADGGSLETQPELGLSDVSEDTERRQAEAQARMAKLRGEAEAPPEPDPDPDPGTRRSLLPDIEEINSSLNSDAGDPGVVQPGDSDDMDVAPQKSGFARGFRTMILLALLGLILYVFAPQIAQTIPALEGTLSAYSDIVNSARGWLDQTVGGLMGTLDGMSSEGS